MEHGLEKPGQITHYQIKKPEHRRKNLIPDEENEKQKDENRIPFKNRLKVR